MLSRLSSSFKGASKPEADHNGPQRAKTYTDIASELESINVPVSTDDCAKCDNPCNAWEGKAYPEYVLERYGDLGALPQGFDTDWDTELAGSAAGGRGRVVVISTGKSDWDRDHTDEKGSFAHKLNKHIQSLKLPVPKDPSKKDFDSRGPPTEYILPHSSAHLPSLYSSSLISQSDDPEDQTVLVFPDWKVVHEVENTSSGAKEFYNALDGPSTGRQKSWVLPYRAVILLCSHKRRDKRCHIAAPLLRSALHTVLDKHNIPIDETGSSLAHLDGPALEDLPDDERETERHKRMSQVKDGEVGIFNINHLGGHRYAGVMLILFPSGAYLSYGRVTPQEIPRVVEDTILQGKIVPGLLRNAVGVQGKTSFLW